MTSYDVASNIHQSLPAYATRCSACSAVAPGPMMPMPTGFPCDSSSCLKISEHQGPTLVHFSAQRKHLLRDMWGVLWGVHLFDFQLNVSLFCGVHGVYCVVSDAKAAQVEVRSGGVEGPAEHVAPISCPCSVDPVAQGLTVSVCLVFLVQTSDSLD